MFLKDYQVKVVSELKSFYGKARETKDAFDTAKKALPIEMRHVLNWVQTTFQTVVKEYKDRCTNGLGEYYPRIIMKVPTGGGKTLLAVEAIREYQNIFARKRCGLVVWIVPSETIYSQTVQKLRDKANPLRQLLDQASGNKTLILEKGQRLTIHDIEENLVILFVMIQSISRQNGKEALKVFQDSGGFESFFPQDNRYDLHAELKKNCPNLDDLPAVFGHIVKTSLGNAIRLSKPFIIIDEIHKVFSDMARKTIDGLNPEMVLGLTATPKTEMNILVTITGLELKNEDMVKLDMHIIPPSGRKEDDWKTMLQEIKEHRDKLEKKAIEYRQSSGLYIRPIALIQVESTGNDQRGKDTVHSLDVKEFLGKLGINSDEIALKTSSQNDIEDVNLFALDCNIRYIITKYALREGWDCSFAYILGIIPNVNSDNGLTQLVGRILRQPFARKTGVPELDESFVYYSKGDTRSILEKVDAGFKREGLEDLVPKIKVSDNEMINKTKTVKIRKEFREYDNVFYLPIWVMIGKGNKKRCFSYELDIKPFIDYSSFTITNEVIKRLEDSFSDETKERRSIIVTLDVESKVSTKYEHSEINQMKEINIDYLTRRYAELMENPFYARKIASSHTEILIKTIGNEKVEENFGYISAFLYNLLLEVKLKGEESLFIGYLNSNKIVLAVSDIKELGFRIPSEENIVVGRMPNPYKYYLFEDVELFSMNSLERKVGDILDKQEKILWWFRNKVSRGWYSIQGWQKYRLCPDFIAARKNNNNELELVYILESKGEQLIGNPDTIYKQKVLNIMTEQKKQKAICHYERMGFGQINDNVEFYLVEQGKEEEELRKYFK
ncbi:hypothetical protein AUJ95_02315 [Candidatus Desantisbacteria bacterium CG2_30_40_21]|uniref:Helicase ATP-binding domain-containing protein n=5 Tax=unclassified Candidatus Desantisiibacteriota TaxID=3106372 RepID=A0A2M7JC89_9BACT|nr:MAG: hypothetical protein AUJ95_02315 [Candidatus Desantisbacteria bacterium CG2_30_40_21]PIP41101.1 MAG: hypothetical protein COX18_04420 [Candidatus Desantisbacteria bacterium CG23_combo_of_CG06-09_8_20_14_all_40_23]PIX16977.1 MAG: hypothetical protein COZ71_05750 [Candidatus Desantisbacteria bacterium CG_4_8_14_3_um_filter_40_12]PIY20092.1 MAG: hypothetical protein COZ13_01880 [Candidatus Desantisbacteria bacterium CG_4_10_14_3_um_filter_40_18]PJB28245.1 MAG: hypothetical protein CO110_10